MQARHVVLISLLGLPFGADAVPIPGTVVLVEYEGTISEVRQAPPEYGVGDRIAGRLYIDRRAGSFGTLGIDFSSYGSDSPTFVSGFWPSTGDGHDSLYIADNVSGPVDIFEVEDWLVASGAPKETGQRFFIHAAVRDFVGPITRLEYQSFEFTTADDIDEPDERMRGGIDFNPMSFVRFVVDRLNVKPNVCAP